MNKVVKAENEKVAAIDFATATETQADGQRRAEIKKAEGTRQAKILEAEGEAQAIQLVNEAADKYFVGNAQMLRKLEAVERALYQNSKVVVPSDTQLVNVIGDLGGLGPEAADRPLERWRRSPSRRECGGGCASAPASSYVGGAPAAQLEHRLVATLDEPAAHARFDLVARLAKRGQALLCTALDLLGVVEGPVLASSDAGEHGAILLGPVADGDEKLEPCRAHELLDPSPAGRRCRSPVRPSRRPPEGGDRAARSRH